MNAKLFLVSNELGKILTDLEDADRVIIEKVDFNACLPSLSVMAPALKNRGRTKNMLLDTEALKRSSVNKSLKAQAFHNESIKRKNALREQIAEFESKIEQQTKLLNTLMKTRDDLERQLETQKTRSRLGSRTILTFEPQPGKQSISSEESYKIQYWKGMYEETERRFQELKKTLSKEGSMLRISANKPKMIPTPKGAPQPTFSLIKRKSTAENNSNDFF